MRKPKGALSLQPISLMNSLDDDDDGERDYKNTAQNLTYLSLKDAILAGSFLPGTVVTLRRLAEMLGTSEMPVREALKRLTAEGAFEAMPNRSARIPILSRRKVLQILDLRLDLESKATEQAAENISKRHIDELVSLEDRMDDYLKSGDIANYTPLNMKFHFLIYQLANNQPLLTVIELLWLRMAPLLGSMVKLSIDRPIKRFGTGRAHHTVIIKALQDHDAAAAKAAMRSDLFSPDELPDYWDALEVVGTAPIQFSGRRRGV